MKLHELIAKLNNLAENLDNAKDLNVVVTEDNSTGIISNILFFDVENIEIEHRDNDINKELVLVIR